MCHDFTRYGETVQFLKSASPRNFGKIIVQNWDLYEKKEKHKFYSLDSMAILKCKLKIHISIIINQ